MSLHSHFPPLPQPDGYAAMKPSGTIIVPPSEYAKHNAYAIFTADQMRDYALAAITSQNSATPPQAPQGAAYFQKLTFDADCFVNGRFMKAGTEFHIQLTAPKTETPEGDKQ